MSRVVVVGGGLVGLSTAMMLTQEGMDVTVLEQDAGQLPDSPAQAWSSWPRSGVGQFQQAHILQAPAYGILRDRIPEALDVLRDADATRFDVSLAMPPSVEDRTPRPGDDKFDTLITRRAVLEHAVASRVRQSVDIRRGVKVAGLIAGSSTMDGVPHVAGVRTADGAEIRADLVVDASGRRTRLPDWLAQLGARPPQEETWDGRTAYYTRFFRSADGKIPDMSGGGLLLQYFDSYSIIVIPADRGHWSVTVVVHSFDQDLKELRHVEKWTDLIRACPNHAHLLEGEAEGGMLIMGGNGDRLRRFVVDGKPIATGLLAVGDVVATTNPTYGRGIYLGLAQAVGTTELVRDHLHDPLELAQEHDTMLAERVVPCYRDTVHLSQNRADQVAAVVNGHPVETPADGERPAHDLFVAGYHDADLFRVILESGLMATPLEELLARPGVVDRATVAAKGLEMPVPAGPARPELLRMLAG
ncbi:NAD(P)/FAD-dependent oxidoreductase [Kibdelosporangium phytohabitans]|uniref:FAD dependent oxidoreductase domain-containing protein n=1 Tax=Kibdelosporangium phytohabitans TaxID=860235 RepID=A0A0N9I0U9_9PSEU|nr:FAD-dependent oxidoreductase [Kibdelosporangium phytohabitans]ALG08293.1 hypothetical protein AOZ06_16485 [Kibdelosporangium phytohabitans]MBE1470682.1 2-polyprenyl-6-methoxyphenol hydroxylase-like FAD-dependent oxidoreductase [Kibdelosporangium phytohabitans]